MSFRYSDSALVLGYFPPLAVPYLAQGDLQLAQEVVVAQVDGFVVDVVNGEYQLLHHFEIVVDDKLLGKLGVEAILDLLRARHLWGGEHNIFFYFVTNVYSRKESKYRMKSFTQVKSMKVQVLECTDAKHVCVINETMHSLTVQYAL